MDREIIDVLDEIVRKVILICDSSVENKLNLNEGAQKFDCESQICHSTNMNEEIEDKGEKRLLPESDSLKNTQIVIKADTIKENKFPVIDKEPLERMTPDSQDKNSSDSTELNADYLNNSKDERIFNHNSIIEINEIDNNPENNLSQNDNRIPNQNSIAELNSVLESNLKDDNRIKNCNLIEKTKFEDDRKITIDDKQIFPITELTRSPLIYGRKVREIEDLAIPSTSTGIVPSVIVINDLSNESSSSAYSTGEMRRRTVENNFAFLSDSDLSDEEIEQILGCENRAYESCDEIEITQETEIVIPVEEYEIIKYNNYIWSSMGFMKVAQVICCITMYVSISLCRFHSKHIQIFCIIGACFSLFILIVYSYRIHIDYWKTYKIRLLLSEYIYLVIYTICDTVFAIIKFEFNEEANYRERMAVMILMISTLIAASTYCYDAILCYSLIEETSKNNSDEKKLLLSYLPTCSKSSRAEICDIFHTCIL